ncbi:unnamed protein product [Kuraishia capsulata CBS 1993]|uniref:Glutamyl-tRNA(Gln) amidotransferase subunit B, mitochondrial n=1 Tax=Kuraishia capsulata CBS 1993 TaxID=1382522 RepID=W6MQ80_9ASCO|nr:uncharacterized protein KUCA_T00004471001 [Kuraishia capsulata CBS 1993]CDK28488.1 unnamed protein product [Kuraishia capsulata CBS 1993]
MRFKVKCGLEIHTQLKTRLKLFSNSLNKSQVLSNKPNTNVSFFDAGLPGTQPVLNYEPVLLALKAAKALKSTVSPISTFDRKHYFYGDQPLGYQITQHYQPIAKGGYLILSSRFDQISQNKTIGIEQIQLEQDTGKTLYKDLTGLAHVDLNRANVPLIELVTKPDFSNPEEIIAFLKQYQYIVKFSDISSGDLETGAIRADVNISIEGGERVEIKNLPTTSAIMHATKYEIKRQISQFEKTGKHITETETRGWNGKQTYKLRDKENAVDYRYMPDPELPPLVLDVDEIMPQVEIEKPRDVRLEELMAEPYGLKLRDAITLLYNPEFHSYYMELFQILTTKKIVKRDLISNWICHEQVGALKKLGRPQDEYLPARVMSELIFSVDKGSIGSNNAKLLLMHLLDNPQDQVLPIAKLIKQFDLGKTTDDELDYAKICENVLSQNEAVIKEIRRTNSQGKLNFLVGQCMRISRGKADANDFRKRLLEMITT